MLLWVVRVAFEFGTKHPSAAAAAAQDSTPLLFSPLFSSLLFTLSLSPTHGNKTSNRERGTGELKRPVKRVRTIKRLENLLALLSCRWTNAKWWTIGRHECLRKSRDVKRFPLFWHISFLIIWFGFLFFTPPPPSRSLHDTAISYYCCSSLWSWLGWWEYESDNGILDVTAIIRSWIISIRTLDYTCCSRGDWKPYSWPLRCSSGPTSQTKTGWKRLDWMWTNLRTSF